MLGTLGAWLICHMLHVVYRQGCQEAGHEAGMVQRGLEKLKGRQTGGRRGCEHLMLASANKLFFKAGLMSPLVPQSE